LGKNCHGLVVHWVWAPRGTMSQAKMGGRGKKTGCSWGGMWFGGQRKEGAITITPRIRSSCPRGRRRGPSDLSRGWRPSYITQILLPRRGKSVIKKKMG